MVDGAPGGPGAGSAGAEGGPRRAVFTGEARTASVAEARRWARGVVTSWDADDLEWELSQLLTEVVTNAVLHGNRKDDNKTVDIVLKSSPDAVEISVHDQGPGFNPEDVPDPTATENLLKTSGRGIFFMRTFMDEVDWLIRPEGGTTVRMLKRR